jgi:tetratricopeptide (TPR) repeat protein
MIAHLAKLDLALIFAGLSLIVSLLTYRMSRENVVKIKLAKSNQLALEAWDMLGGKPGSFRIKDAPTQDHMILAKRKIDEALAINPKSRKANSVLGTYYMLSKDYQAAADVHEKLTKADPSDAITLYNLGDAYSKLGMPNKAVDAYQRSISWLPTRDATHHNLAHVFIEIEEPDEAIQEFNAAIALNPSCVDSHHDLACLYSKLGDSHKSTEVLLAALDNITEDLDRSKIYNLLGCEYRRTGSPAKAIEALEVATELDHHSAAAHENLARAYASIGRYSDARDELIYAKRIEPKNLQHYFNLGIIYLELKMFDDAQEAFQMVLRRDPSFPDIQNKLKLATKNQSK